MREKFLRTKMVYAISFLSWTNFGLTANDSTFKLEVSFRWTNAIYDSRWPVLKNQSNNDRQYSLKVKDHCPPRPYNWENDLIGVERHIFVFPYFLSNTHQSSHFLCPRNE